MIIYRRVLFLGLVQCFVHSSRNKSSDNVKGRQENKTGRDVPKSCVCIMLLGCQLYCVYIVASEPGASLFCLGLLIF